MRSGWTIVVEGYILGDQIAVVLQTSVQESSHRNPELVFHCSATCNLVRAPTDPVDFGVVMAIIETSKYSCIQGSGSAGSLRESGAQPPAITADQVRSAWNLELQFLLLAFC